MIGVSQLDDLERGARVAGVAEELLRSTLDRRPETVAALVGKGSIAWAIANMAGLGANALMLAQYAYVVRKDAVAARRWLQLLADVEPGFSTFARYMQEAMHGERSWDRQLLSLETQLEPVLCLLLLGRVEDVAERYKAVRERTLFNVAEARAIRATLTRHLILASLGDLSGVTEQDYARCTDLRKVVVFKDYHLLMLALASGDTVKFNTELAAIATLFRKRKSSKLIHKEWGFGEAASWCFDALGTAICRLAARQGLAIEVPDSRLYPDDFWRDR